MTLKFRSLFKRNKQKNERTAEDNVDMLLNHPIFAELQEWCLYRSKVLDIKNPIKRRMAEFYLGLLFNKLIEMIDDAVDQYEEYLDNTASMNTLIIDTINLVNQTSAANGVPSIFLDKITNYLYRQAKILTNTFKDLDNFEYYKNDLERASFRLDIGFMLVRCITSEIESIINDMNGELQAALEGSIFDK